MKYMVTRYDTDEVAVLGNIAAAYRHAAKIVVVPDTVLPTVIQKLKTNKFVEIQAKNQPEIYAQIEKFDLLTGHNTYMKERYND